jgi:hypothetical protein
MFNCKKFPKLHIRPPCLILLMIHPRIGEYFPAKAEKWEIRIITIMVTKGRSKNLWKWEIRFMTSAWMFLCSCCGHLGYSTMKCGILVTQFWTTDAYRPNDVSSVWFWKALPIYHILQRHDFEDHNMSPHFRGNLTLYSTCFSKIHCKRFYERSLLKT